MRATIIKLSETPTNKKLSKKQQEFQKKLLNGPTMTPKQIKEFEKRYPWLKKYRD